MEQASDLRVLHQGQHLRLVRRGGWEFAQRRYASGAVVMVALTPGGALLLTEQFRPPVQARVIELPAGLVGDRPGDETEAMAVAAKRELLEETGYDAGTMTWLAQGPASAGVSDETVAFFHAQQLRKLHGGGGDEHENILVHEVPLAALDSWLEQKRGEGAVIDVKIYAGLFLLHRARRTCD